MGSWYKRAREAIVDLPRSRDVSLLMGAHEPILNVKLQQSSAASATTRGRVCNTNRVFWFTANCGRLSQVMKELDAKRSELIALGDGPRMIDEGRTHRNWGGLPEKHRAIREIFDAKQEQAKNCSTQIGMAEEYE